MMSDILFFCGIIVVICCIVEAGILAYAFFTADEISCNWFFCTFTNHVSSITEQWDSQKCFRNGVQVDCTALDNNSSGWGW